MDDEEMRDDLGEGDKLGRIRRKKPMIGDDLIDPLEAMDIEDAVEETEEEDDDVEDEY